MKKNILAVIALILALISLALCGMTISAAWDMADRYDAQLAWMDERYASLDARLAALESRFGALEAQPDVPVPSEPAPTEAPAASEAYCNLIIGDWTFEGDTLTVSTAFAQVLAENNALETAVIRLETGSEPITLPIEMHPGEAAHSYELDLTNLVFVLSDLSEGDMMALHLDVTLSDGQALTACAATWEYLEGKLHMSVG